MPNLRVFDDMEMDGEVATVSPEQVSRFRPLLAQVEGTANTIPADFFREHYDEFGPEVMLAALDEDPLCHSAAHGLGRVIYERTQDLAAATNICRRQCGKGCIHGVLMGMFTDRSKTDTTDAEERHARIDDLTPALRSELGTMCENSAVTRYLDEGNCYHAVGHALMTLADYNIPDGLALCDVFKEKGPGAVYYCATGMYMERDIALGEQDARVSKTYPCDENLYPAACFRYKLRHVFDLSRGYKLAADVCLGLDGANRRGCFHGLGFGAINAIYQKPSLASEVCAAGDESDRRMCLEGAFGILNTVDRSIAKKSCESFSAKERALCDAASTSRNYGMDRDFALYMSTE